MRRLSSVVFAGALCLAGQGVAASEVVIDQGAAFDCLRAMDETTTWGQCLGLTFAPCAVHEVGTRDHGQCLLDLRNLWRDDMEARRAEVMEAITPAGGQALSALLDAWPKYLDDKCTAVAALRSQTGEASALLGCEVSEYMLLSSEFDACLDGRSPEEYCQRVE